MKRYDILYQVDENDNLRVWWMDQSGDKYRTVSGIEGGKLVTSEWKLAKPKNVGRANATTGEQQAEAEILSQYTKKRDRKYHDTRELALAGGSKIIEPMLADKFKGWDNKWKFVYSQPKLDGMRCLATKDGLFSRQGKPIVSAPHIMEALKTTFEVFTDLVLDGELYNHKFRDNFNELISIARQTKPSAEDIAKSAELLEYHVYDMMDNNHFSDRGEFLLDLRIKHPSIHLVPTTQIFSPDELDAEYAELLSMGYEGQMIRLDAPYEQKRSKSLLKRKEFQDEEFEVVELQEGQGNWAGYAKSVVCRDKHGVIFSAGIKGTQEFTKQLLTMRPKTVTVRYQNKTPDGSYRFPIAVAFFENERDV
jgi:DNA ligase-1